MRRVALPMILVLVALLASCNAPGDVAAPMVPGAQPLMDTGDLNCDLPEYQRDIIRAGIQHLLDHANEACKNAGSAALGRFEAPAASGNGYRSATQEPDIDMGVDMHAGSSPSGGVPTNGYVDVYASFWTSGATDATHTGGLLAHEE